jgi:hypothetical protein
MPPVEVESELQKYFQSFDDDTNIKKIRKTRRSVEIDTLKQTFFTDFILTLQWDQKKDQPSKIPSIYFKNSKETTKIPCSCPLIRYPKSTDAESFQIRRRFQCTFYNNYDLRQFPFDKQVFFIFLRIESKRKNKSIIPELQHNEEVQSLYSISVKNNPEWKFNTQLYSISKKNIVECVVWGKYIKESLTNTTITDKDIAFIMCAKRNTTLYICKIGLPVALLQLCNMTCLAIDPDDYIDRFTVTGTVLLTTVAFNFTFNDNIPRTNYLTEFDKYITLSFVISFMFIMENALVLLVPETLRNAVDRTLILILFGTWTITHAIAIKRWFQFRNFHKLTG